MWLKIVVVVLLLPSGINIRSQLPVTSVPGGSDLSSLDGMCVQIHTNTLNQILEKRKRDLPKPKPLKKSKESLEENQTKPNRLSSGQSHLLLCYGGGGT